MLKLYLAFTGSVGVNSIFSLVSVVNLLNLNEHRYSEDFLFLSRIGPYLFSESIFEAKNHLIALNDFVLL